MPEKEASDGAIRGPTEETNDTPDAQREGNAELAVSESGVQYPVESVGPEERQQGGERENPAAADNPDQVAGKLATDAGDSQAGEGVAPAEDPVLPPPPQHWAQLAKLTSEDGSWFVERTWPTSTADAGKIPVRPFIGPAVYVRCQYGLTLNLGRYESARIDVSLSVPCYPAEVEETYQFVSKWVSERVLQERAEIDQYRQSAVGDVSQPA